MGLFSLCAFGPHHQDGFTRDVDQRPLKIQSMSAEKLKVLCVVQASMQIEREIFRHFAAHRLHGEWFQAHTSLFEFIGALPENSPLTDELLAQLFSSK